MTITATEAYEAMLAHHARLGEELASRADGVSAAVAAGRPYGTAVAGLITYLAEEVLPHAAAEEKAIYPAAAARANMAGMVGEMVADHVTLSALGARLAAATDPAAAAGQAEQIATLFTAHAARENDVLLPALLNDAAVDFAVLLEQMHDHAPAAADAGTPALDSQATVVSLLIQAAAALARAGDADRACTIAASAWAALHDSRPDLAAKVTAALHGLARRVGQDSPAGPASGAAGPAGGREPATAAAPRDRLLDVRELAPAQRHETIFAAYRDLAPGAGFLLVNDHDPKPLRYQFEAEHAGQFTWDYLESGPEVWRVRVGRPAADAQEPELDVRQVSHGQRHGLIFTAYTSLRPGQGFVLVNDHDPKPLRYQFEAQYAGDYTWDYQEAGPKVWRVRIGRPGE